MTGCIVGWAHTPFGKLETADVEGLIKCVAVEAIADAHVDIQDIDAIYLGVFNNGFSKQGFCASLVLQADERFRFKPATRVENACSSGSAAIHAGLNFVDAKRGRLALVIGAEKMTSTPAHETGDILLGASYRKEEAMEFGGFAGIFGRIAEEYFRKYGDRSDALARIAAKNHKNGVANPFAQFRKDLGFEFCRTASPSNPFIAAPLRRTDCAPISDGAAAVVIADCEIARQMNKAVGFRAALHINDYMPISRRDITRFDGAELAWKQALAAANLDLMDLDLVETHDCFTIAELIEYEAMGLVGRGCGWRAIEEGWTEKDGKLPINPSGGLKAKGHPIAATGVSMHVLGAMQVLGTAGDMQIPGAQLAGVFNMGGTAVANYVSILERLR